MRAASLFSGIGAPEVAMPGWQWLWHAEIEAFPSAVMAARHPGSVNLGDVNAPDFVERAEAFGPLDVLVAGWPCQDLSVAGKRAGLAGKRSGLFYSMMHIVESIEPRYLVLENVPGLLSVNNGADFQKVMEALSDAGYIVDVDVLDAQFFGVPQRRRRLFWACVRLDVSLRMKTPFSAHIAAECVAQTLRGTWDALLAASSAGPQGSGCESPTEHPAVSARKKINAFARASDGEACTRLLETWVGQFRHFMGEPSFSAWISRLHQERPAADCTADIGLSALNGTGSSDGCRSIGSLWSELLDDASPKASMSTTSIWTNKTTDRKTLAFAKASVTIAQSTMALASSFRTSASSADLWNLASSVLSMMEGITNYARQSAGTIFAWHEHTADWWACVDAARACAYVAHRCVGNRPDPGSLFSFGESLRWHPAPGHEARQAVAGSLGAGSRRSGGRIGRREAAAGHVVARSLNAHPSRSDGESETFVTHSLRADGFDASEDGTGRGTPLVPVACIKGAAIGREPHNGPQYGEVLTDGTSFTLNCVDRHAVAFTCKDSGLDSGPIAPTRRAMPHDGGHANAGGQVAVAMAVNEVMATLCRDPGGPASQDWQWHAAAYHGTAVRRLTPRECERLQGFPDDWTLIKYKNKDAADGPRYKALGNSMAVPCIAWVLQRIEIAHRSIVVRDAA